MTTRTHTGGLKTFVYPKNHNPQLTTEEKLEFEDAYKKIDARKKKEIIIKVGAIVIIILIIGIYLIFK